MILDHYARGHPLAREALEAASARGLPLVEGRARNTLGDSLAMTGDVEAGAAELRAAIAIAREHDDLADLGLAYLNYSNMLHVLGRSEEALAVAAEGRGAVGGRRPISMLWFDMKNRRVRVRQRRLGARRGGAAERGAVDRGAVALRHRAAAGGAGARQGRRSGGRRAARRARADGRGVVSEPQALGAFRVLAAELHRRAGDLEAARGAVDRGSSGSRLRRRRDRRAAVAGHGCDRGRRRAERAATSAMPRRRRAALQRVGRAARARGRRRPPRPGRSSALRCWARARRPAAQRAGRTRRSTRRLPRRGTSSAARSQPPADVARALSSSTVRPGGTATRGRRARHARRTRPRSGSAPAGCEARSRASRPAPGWTLEPDDTDHDEPESARGGRVRPHLTRAPGAGAARRRCHEPRDRRDVVHGPEDRGAVQRFTVLLSKLNVRSRTEAAAVAHRQGLADPGGRPLAGASRRSIRR